MHGLASALHGKRQSAIGRQDRPLQGGNIQTEAWGPGRGEVGENFQAEERAPVKAFPRAGKTHVSEQEKATVAAEGEQGERRKR